MIWSWFQTHYFFTAVCEWTSCMTYILLLPRKGRGRYYLFTSLGMFGLQTLFLYLTTAVVIDWIPLNVWEWMMIRMPFHIFLMWMQIRITCRTTVANTVCLTMKAFLLAEFVWSFIYKVCYPFLSANFWEPWIAVLASAGTMVLIYGFIFFYEKNFAEQIMKSTMETRETGRIVLLTIMIFLTSAISSSNPHNFLGDRFDVWINVSQPLIDFLGIMFLSEYCMKRTTDHAMQELKIIKVLMEKQTIQFQNSHQDIELINQKYHDIKHMLYLFRNNSLPEHNQKYFDKLQQENQNYEACAKTGNDTLDTILSEKHIYCLQHNITLSYVIDGVLLDGIDPLDLCVIFGNALDNAIECVAGLEDPDHRLIQMAVFEKAGFIHIRFENIIEKQPDMQEDLPVTTKGDTDYHGYGLKSIRYLVEKYQGVFSIQTNQNWFKLKIMLPK